MKVREYRADDEAAVRAIWTLAFYGNSGRDEERPLVRDDEIGYVVEVDGRVVAGLKVVDMTASCGGADMRCGGISSVGVAPEHRHTGVGNHLMEWTLRRMRSEGFLITSLHPFRASYYRKLGYEFAGSVVSVRCPQGRLPRTPVGSVVRQIGEDDWRLLEPAYAAFAGRYSGMSRRGKDRWEKVVGGAGTTRTVLAVGDPVEAYAVVAMTDRVWEEEEVKEFVWSTPESYREMLAVLSRLAINRSGLKWREPINGPFRWAFSDQGVTFKLARPPMYRVLDVPGVLRAMKMVPPGECRIAVRDDLFAGNRGPWLVESERGGPYVKESQKADIVLDVRHLTQAVLGEPSLFELLQAGVVDCADPRSLFGGGMVFPSQATYCLEEF